MAGVLWLLIVGLDRCCINAGSWSSAPEARAVGVGCLVPRRRKRKAPQGINLREPKKYEAACACRSPVTQKSRSQARLFLPAKPFCENLASLLPRIILVKVTKKSSFGLHDHNAFLSEIAPSETAVYLDGTFQIHS